MISRNSSEVPDKKTILENMVYCQKKRTAGFYDSNLRSQHSGGCNRKVLMCVKPTWATRRKKVEFRSTVI